MTNEQQKHFTQMVQAVKLIIEKVDQIDNRLQEVEARLEDRAPAPDGVAVFDKQAPALEASQ